MFRFEVNWWDKDFNDMSNEKGIVAAADYGAAANRVVEYYGKENVVDIKLYELEDVLVDEEIADECAK
jgi:hypothetical protein